MNRGGWLVALAVIVGLSGCSSPADVSDPDRTGMGMAGEGNGEPSRFPDVTGTILEDGSWLVQLDTASAEEMESTQAFLRPVEGAVVECSDGRKATRDQLRAGWQVEARVLGIEQMQPISLPSDKIVVYCS
jgi:hypothetical protein